MSTLRASFGSALVGRERQLAVLRDRLDRAASGRGGAVLVTGEAGVGKSRLVRQAVVEATGIGATVVEGRCVAVGGEPLRHAALAEAVRSARRPGEPLPSRAGATPEALLEELLVALDAAGGRGPAPGAGGGAAPLVVVIEDLHWADRATCEVLMVLAREAQSRSACLLLTSRDDELPRGHHVRVFLAELVRAQLVLGVRLARLGAADVARLTERLVGPVDPATAAVVFERSGGNPLLIEELCASARPLAGTRAGVATREGAAAPGPEALGDELREVLLARADALSPAALAVAQAVAAAGRPVGEEVLLEVAGADGAAGLREALDHHLLVRTGDDVGFRHVLVAEAVYGQMLRTERAAVHARWADALDRRGEVPAVLAHHWAEAGAADRALAASVAAGDAAGMALTAQDAVVHYRRALALWDRVPDAATAAGVGRVELSLRAAEAANWSGDPTTAVALVADTLALAPPPPRRATPPTTDAPAPTPARAVDSAPGGPAVGGGGGGGEGIDAVTASRLRERHGWYQLRRGDVEAARRSYRDAVEGLPADAGPEAHARVLAGSVRIWERLRDPGAALATADAAMAAAEASGGAAERAAALYMRARALLLAGRTEDAVDELRRAAEAAERVGDAVTLSIALLDRADALAPAGRLGEAVVEARAAAGRLRAAGLSDPHALLAEGVAAAVLYRQGRAAEARAAAEALAASGRTAVTLALGHALVGMADLDARVLGDAREHLEMARFLAAPLLDGRIAGNLGLGRAELALAEGRSDDARSAVDEGIAQVERTGDDEVLALLCLAGLRIVADRAQGADRRSTERAKEREAAAIDRYASRLGTLVAGPTGIAAPTVAAIEAAWAAERSRLDGATDPDAWADVARRWRRVEQPRLAVLATIRRAEAAQRGPDRRADAPSALAEALEGAHAIGSRLLAESAREVARRAGVPLPTGEPAGTGTGAGVGTDPGGEPTHGGNGRRAGDDGWAAGAASAGAGGPGGGGLTLVAPLTRREREVLELVASGATNRQIGAMLYISTKTASVHVSRILAKLGAATRGEAAAVARQAGVVRD